MYKQYIVEFVVLLGTMGGFTWFEAFLLTSLVHLSIDNKTVKKAVTLLSVCVMGYIDLKKGALILAFWLFDNCKLLEVRSKTEKLILCWILIEGLLNQQLLFWKEFCIFFIIYFLIASQNVLIKKAKLRIFILNLIFICFYVFMLSAYQDYIKYLIYHKRLLIISMLVAIVFGILLITVIKMRYTLSKQVERKYFHLLALVLFFYTITKEVS